MGKVPPRAPQMPPDESEHITKGGSVLAIPGRLSDRDLPIGAQRLPKEGHQTGEAKEQRRPTLHGSIRPWTLRLDAQMGAPLLKGPFQTPARNFVADDLLCRLGRIGGKDGFGGRLAPGITSQHPPDRQGSGSIALPQRGASADLQRSFPLAIAVQGEFLPDRFGVLYDRFQGRQAKASDTRTANGVSGALGRGLMEDSIESASRDQSQPASQWHADLVPARWRRSHPSA